VTRPLLSGDPENFSLAVSRDEFVVHPVATDDWCRKHLGNAEAPELAAIVSQYRRVSNSLWMARGRSAPSFWSMTESVIVNRLVHGHAFGDLMYWLPRVSFASFDEDPAFVTGVARLRRSGARLVLVHLPIERELKAGRPSFTRGENSLWSSLERSFGQAVSQIAGRVDGRRVPERLNLAPIDLHPTSEGLRFYAEQVTELFAERRDARVERVRSPHRGETRLAQQ
jgi:hypothetical protein